MLSTVRVRLYFAVAVWVATIAAIALWFATGVTPQIRLAAGERGSESYLVANAIADTLSRGNFGFNIRVYDTGGSAESLELVTNGRVDIAVVQASLVRPSTVLDIARLYPDAYHLLVYADLDVSKASDLRGLRIATPPLDSGQNEVFRHLIAHYNLRQDEFSALPMGAEAAYFALATRQVDAAFMVRSPGNLQLRKLLASGELKLVPIEQGPAMALNDSSIRGGLIPRGAYGGEPAVPPEDLSTPVMDKVLVAHENLPEELVYKFTRRLFEQQADIAKITPLGGFIAQLDARSGVDSKTHPGARRFYDREKPGIVQQNARLASALLYFVVLLASGVLALRGRWLKARRLRMVDFNNRLMEIAKLAKDSVDRTELLGFKRGLMEVLEEVVQDLDSDKVSPEEFEHFSFTWQAVDSLVRDQLQLQVPPALQADSHQGNPA